MCCARPRPRAFQCSSASRKFLNLILNFCRRLPVRVSVLFSEPKISQSKPAADIDCAKASFSALQRAENFSIAEFLDDGGAVFRFQCSSASRKFLNYHLAPERPRCRRVSVLFSEPKISQLPYLTQLVAAAAEFQCSSASRKFLNSNAARWLRSGNASFSALQRAENFSIWSHWQKRVTTYGFSALQRAENFSISEQFVVRTPALVFQCSSASRKFLNFELGSSTQFSAQRFSALQRAENFSISDNINRAGERGLFQCSSASRKFLNCRQPDRCVNDIRVSVLFSEPKISQFVVYQRTVPEDRRVSVLFSEPKISQFDEGNA